ncbi:MAG: PAS domain-containing protein [Burkholderiaceae bacterium]
MRDAVDPGFLGGGGEMGARMRAFDWTSTPLGRPSAWPQALRTAVRLLLNTGHPMYIFWGVEGTCIYNDAYSRSIGPERHPGSLGQPARAVWDEIWHIIGPQIAQVMDGRGSTWHENDLVPITRNGKREDVYWTYSYAPIDDSSLPSGVGGVLVICAETTAQVESQRRLLEGEQRLQLALSAGRGIGIWDWDVVSDHVVADDRFARLYGVAPERAQLGAPIGEFFAGIHADDLARVQSEVEVAVRTGEAFSTEYRIVQRDGPIRWVATEGRCQLAADGAPVRFPGVSFDITERKLAEERLRELNADLERKVIERAQARGRTWQVSPDLLGALNDRGYFDTSNPAWETVLGWSEQEVASMSMFEMLHPDDVERTRSGFKLTQHGKPVIRFPNRYRCKDGSYRWISWVGVPEDGLVYCSGRDITDETERAQALEQAENALRQSQKMEAVGQLTGGLAHDFNNLLAGISGSLEITETRIAQGRAAEVARYLSAAKAAVQRAAALTHRLLAFSRRQSLDPKPTDLNRLIAGMEELIRRTVGPGIVLEIKGDGALWLTLVDRNQLENVLLNLCINGRDAMPAGGQLTIATANQSLDRRAASERDLAPGEYLTMAVTDSGTGMGADVVAKACDPFFTTKPFGTGTGLGLSMAYGFARQSGGQLRIASEIGRGTTVTLYLPRHAGASEAPTIAAVPIAEAHAKPGEVVLVIDDDATIRLLVSEVLEDAGYAVLVAHDGSAGLRVVQSGTRIDLLVTDIGLPGGLSGWQIADEARRARPEMRVLFITGYAENASSADGMLAPGMALIAKPFAMQELKRKVREMLDS